QLQHALRQGVGLGEHGGACLLQDLPAGEVGGLGGEIGITNPAARGGEVLRGGLQVGDGGFEARLQGAELGALAVDCGQGRIDDGERAVGGVDRADVEVGDLLQRGCGGGGDVEEAAACAATGVDRTEGFVRIEGDLAGDEQRVGGGPRSQAVGGGGGSRAGQRAAGGVGDGEVVAG